VSVKRERQSYRWQIESDWKTELQETKWILLTGFSKYLSYRVMVQLACLVPMLAVMERWGVGRQVRFEAELFIKDVNIFDLPFKKYC